MKTRIKASDNTLICEEAKCSCRVNNPVILIDVEELLNKHSELRDFLRQFGERWEEPRRCDCIVGRIDESGLVVETVEFKGSLAWIKGTNDKEKAMKKFANALAEKHVACIVLVARLLGPPAGSYRLGCITFARSTSMLGPILLHISRHIHIGIRMALQKAAQSGLLTGKPSQYKCYNWADRKANERSLLESCGHSCG